MTPVDGRRRRRALLTLSAYVVPAVLAGFLLGWLAGALLDCLTT